MKQIQGIVFDFGGVLLTDEDVGFTFDNEYVKSKFKKEDKELLEVWDKHWRSVGEGKVEFKTFYNNLQMDLMGSFDQNLTEKLIKEYREHTKPLEPYSFLPRLSKQVKLYALTNMTAYGLTFKRKAYDLDKYFKLIVSSSDEGISKPDPEIFNTLIRRAKIEPQETLFVDDREKNTKQAEKMGFETLLYKSSDELLDKLASLGIKI